MLEAQWPWEPSRFDRRLPRWQAIRAWPVKAIWIQGRYVLEYELERHVDSQNGNLRGNQNKKGTVFFHSAFSVKL